MNTEIFVVMIFLHVCRLSDRGSFRGDRHTNTLVSRAHSRDRVRNTDRRDVDRSDRRDRIRSPHHDSRSERKSERGLVSNDRRGKQLHDSFFIPYFKHYHRK